MNVLLNLIKSGDWRLVTLSILVVAIAARIVVSNEDYFSSDNYVLMIGVENGFFQYHNSQQFGFPFEVHYWLSYRVFGNSLSGYLVPLVIASIGTILVVYWGLRRYWHSTFGICFFTLAILALNLQSLWLAKSAMLPYGNDLFLSACLYFLFLRLSMGRLTRRQWIWITACLVPAAFFSNLFIVVPAATGVFSVVVFRWWQAPTRRNLKYLSQSLMEMSPLAIFPLMHFALYWLSPAFLTIARRLGVQPLYFYSSPYPYTLWGAVQFVSNNTVELFKGLLDSYPSVEILGIGKPFWIIVTIGVAIIVIVLAIRLIQRRLDPKVSFTLIFVVVTFSAIAVGGLLGVYPFGRARYADYLLIPVAVLIAYVASSALKLMLPKIKIIRDSKVLPVMLAAIILVFGACYCILSYHHHSLAKAHNYAAMEEICTFYSEIDAELVMVDPGSIGALSIRCKDLSERMDIFLERHDPVFDQSMVQSIESESIKSILVIAPGSEDFISFYPFLSNSIVANFNQDHSIEGPAIWGGFFTKK